jgi:hypothetical protein
LCGYESWSHSLRTLLVGFEVLTDIEYFSQVTQCYKPEDHAIQNLTWSHETDKRFCTKIMQMLSYLREVFPWVTKARKVQIVQYKTEMEICFSWWHDSLLCNHRADITYSSETQYIFTIFYKNCWKRSPSSFNNALQHVSMFAAWSSEVHPWNQAITHYFILECIGGVEFPQR